MTAAVEVENVSRQFRLYHERYTTLKERLVHFGRQSYEPYWALRGVSVTVDKGETMGLIGANGSGKTTLLKVIAGILRPTDGRVRTRGRVAALLELGAGFHPDLTGRENVYMNASILGLTKKETDRHFDDMVAFAELEPFIDNQVKHYSSGMYVRLGFAVAVHVDPQILLVDEVLAVGDEAFQAKCLDRVRQFQKEGRTIVFVTHAVELVRSICHRAVALHHGEVISLGPPADAIRTYRDQVHGESHLEAAPTEERGSGEVRIIEVKLLDADGVERQIFHPGEVMEISLVIEARSPVDDPVVGVVIYDDRDVAIFGTNTARRGIDLGRLEGKARVRMRAPALPVLDGRCLVTLGVHSRDDRHVYHWREKVNAFRVVNGGPDIGRANFAMTLEVERL